MKFKKPALNELEEVPSITGLLASYGDTTHQFTPKNECPYFMGKSELCFLSGRICLYDSETFPACQTYTTGFEKKLPSPAGKEPTVAPQNMDTIIGQPETLDGPQRPLFKS